MLINYEIGMRICTYYYKIFDTNKKKGRNPGLVRSVMTAMNRTQSKGTQVRNTAREIKLGDYKKNLIHI